MFDHYLAVIGCTIHALVASAEKFRPGNAEGARGAPFQPGSQVAGAPAKVAETASMTGLTEEESDVEKFLKRVALNVRFLRSRWGVLGVVLVGLLAAAILLLANAKDIKENFEVVGLGKPPAEEPPGANAAPRTESIPTSAPTDAASGPPTVVVSPGKPPQRELESQASGPPKAVLPIAKAAPKPSSPSTVIKNCTFSGGVNEGTLNQNCGD